MKPTPKNWPRISSALYYDQPLEAIDWLCRAFGFEVRLKVVSDQGVLQHSELTYGEGVIMVATPRELRKSPSQAGGANTQNMFAYVDDVEAHCARARAAGARITTDLRTTDHGEGYWEDRSYEAEDLGGHRWWFAQRLRDR